MFGRKLLYGSEHDSVEHLPEGADAESYGKVELHRMHAIWRRNSLKMLSDLVRRAPKGQPVKLRKVPGRSGPAVWPGELGKHHKLIEEMLELEVVTLHQDDDAHAYALVHAAPLHRAYERYCSAAAMGAEAEATTAAPAATNGALAAAVATASSNPFVAAQAFAGAWPGYVFKKGPHGLGYYADTELANAALAAEQLPYAPSPLLAICCI